MKKIKAALSKMPMMLTCGEVEAILFDYVEGRLTGYARFKFEFHIKACRECRDYLAAYKKTMALGGQVLGDRGDPAPEDLPDDLVAAILAARDGETGGATE